MKNMGSDVNTVKISRHVAEDIGLIPEPEYWLASIATILFGDIKSIRDHNRAARENHISKYCDDVELELCEFPRTIVEAALRGKHGR